MSCLKDRRWLATSECKTRNYKNLVAYYNNRAQCQQPAKTWGWWQLIKGAHLLLSVPLALNRGRCSVGFQAPLSTCAFCDLDAVSCKCLASWCHVKRSSARDASDPKEWQLMRQISEVGSVVSLSVQPQWQNISAPGEDDKLSNQDNLCLYVRTHRWTCGNVEFRSTLAENNDICS